MIVRFKWCVCCLLVTVTQFILSPIAPNAAAAMQPGGATPGTLPSNKPSGHISSPQAPLVPNAVVLQVTISAGRDMVAAGESVGYDLTVVNTSTLLAASDVRLMNLVPAGFRFNKGSAKLNGSAVSDPAISSDGRVLTFRVGNLAPGASSTLRFEAEIPVGSPQDKAVNVASAFSSGSGTSNVAKAIVSVRDVVQEVKTPATIAPAGSSEPLQPSVQPTVTPLPADTAAVAVKAAVPVLQPVVPSPVIASPPVSPTAPAADASKAVVTVPPPVVPAPVPLLPPLPAKVPVVDDKGIVAQAAEAAAQPVVPSPDLSSPLPVLQDMADKEEKLPSDDPVTGDFVVQKTQSLAELIGTTDISVLSDVDGQFVKSMAENQTLENERASQVDETNLLDSIRVGRRFNRESRAALARTEQANAQTGQAFALLLPSVTVRANYGAEISDPNVAADSSGKLISPNTPDTHSRVDASLSVRQTLFDLPVFMDWQRRKVVEQARGENYKVNDGEAYISAVNAYLSIVSSRLQTDMTREFETRLNDLLIYVEKRAKAGAASNSDMARVRARSQATLSSRLEQESAHAAAGIEFIRLTNLVPRKVRLPVLDDVGAVQLPNSLDLAVTKAMKSNPEIAALTAEIEAAEIDKQAAKGRYLPRVDAEYTNSYSLHAGGSTSSAGQKDQRVMMVLNWSLFSGGSDYKSHVERTARHKELQYRLDDQRRRVVQTLSANYATLATTRERITSGYQELKSISTAAEAMSKRMISGNQSLLDMLDVYDRLYQVRSRLVSLHILEMSTAAQIVRLIQGTPVAVAGLQSK